jgi:Flp pilus assembly protein CpaB
MRKLFLILGGVLAVVVAAGVYFFLQSSRPVIVEVPVAIVDIPAGSTLSANMFRIERMSNVDKETLAKWVLKGDWPKADGKVTTSDVRAGFPLAKAQVDPNSTDAQETRLSYALTGTEDYYIVLPVKPDEVGNYIQPNDRIDVIVNFGAGDQKGALTLPVSDTTPSEMQVAEGDGVAPTGAMTKTIEPPITKLLIQNLQILRIDRDAAKSSGDSSKAAPPTGDVKRLYIKVTRDQLEVLSFVLNNGKHSYAVRAAISGNDALPTDGVTWDDFVRWFFAQRGNDVNGPQPFNIISPSEPADSSK